MLTTITIDAKCTGDKQAEIKITDGETVVVEQTIERGDSSTHYLFNNQQLLVREILK